MFEWFEWMSAINRKAVWRKDKYLCDYVTLFRTLLSINWGFDGLAEEKSNIIHRQFIPLIIGSDPHLKYS